MRGEVGSVSFGECARGLRLPLAPRSPLRSWEIRERPTPSGCGRARVPREASCPEAMKYPTPLSASAVGSGVLFMQQKEAERRMSGPSQPAGPMTQRAVIRPRHRCAWE